VPQVADRAARLGLGLRQLQILLLSENRLEAVARVVQELQPLALVIDSIQTVYLEGLSNRPGSITQARGRGAARAGPARRALRAPPPAPCALRLASPTCFP
jgi:DNA repair protein RadA/Sms